MVELEKGLDAHLTFELYIITLTQTNISMGLGKLKCANSDVLLSQTKFWQFI